MFRAWQRVLLIYLPGTIYFGLVAGIWLLRDRLPDPAASHYSQGVPDASMPLAQLVLISLLPPVLTWLFLLVIVRQRMPGSLGRRVGAALIVGETFLNGTAVVLGLVRANLDAAVWTGASSPPEHATYVTVMGVIGLVAGGALVEPWRVPEPPPLPPAEPRTELARGSAPGEDSGRRRLWFGRARNRFLLAYSALGLVLFLVILPWNPWTLAGAVYTLVTIHLAGGVFVTFNGETLKVYGFPPVVALRRIPLSRMETAEVVTVDPLAWGGWGWRLLSSKRHAFVIRGGETLLIALRGGGEFLITVSSAGVGAALIRQALLRRAEADRETPGRAFLPDA
ncbi:hypothetical protein [Streptosporangium sp. NPDC002524]|uniref:hypothetical protein n=1 Tax=Streptosporangium sp. NPDC002524 TaxID=3154537 RepID=UPI003331AC58